MAGRHAATARNLFVAGAVLAFALLGVTWLTSRGYSLSGRKLDVRVFVVPAALFAVAAAASAATSPRRAGRAATGALISLGAAFAVAVRQLGVDNIKPTALVVLGGAAAALLVGRRRLMAAPA